MEPYLAYHLFVSITLHGFSLPVTHDQFNHHHVRVNLVSILFLFERDHLVLTATFFGAADRVSAIAAIISTS